VIVVIVIVVIVVIVVVDLLSKRKRNNAKGKMLVRANKRDKQAAKKKDIYRVFVVL
jgi:FtsZ-interacting cell division protein ZipA